MLYNIIYSKGLNQFPNGNFEILEFGDLELPETEVLFIVHCQNEEVKNLMQITLYLSNTTT
ncbi:MAG: hypothetical protein A2046_11285 [Bacteroidetes bacterium GWA2_30_7]|nr:MAG: hypothetical protein A2046_11285 [Bacteroidetes bacterium GWA2_30_7]